MGEVEGHNLDHQRAPNFLLLPMLNFNDLPPVLPSEPLLLINMLLTSVAHVAGLTHQTDPRAVPPVCGRKQTDHRSTLTAGIFGAFINETGARCRRCVGDMLVVMCARDIKVFWPRVSDDSIFWPLRQ